MYKNRPKLKDSSNAQQKSKVINTIKLIRLLETEETANLIRYIDHIKNLNKHIDYLEAKVKKLRSCETKLELHIEKNDEIRREFGEQIIKYAQITRQLYETQAANRQQAEYITELETKLNDQG